MTNEKYTMIDLYQGIAVIMITLWVVMFIWVFTMWIKHRINYKKWGMRNPFSLIEFAEEYTFFMWLTWVDCALVFIYALLWFGLVIGKMI